MFDRIPRGRELNRRMCLVIVPFAEYVLERYGGLRENVVIGGVKILQLLRYV